MNFSEYESIAFSTAIYPQRGNNLAYPILGLIEETSEVVEKIDKLDKIGLMKELGDQTWYIASVCFELSIPFFNLESKITTLPISKNLPLLNIMEESIGKIAAIAKKSIRDNNGKITEDKKNICIDHLSTILSAIHTLSFMHGFSLEDVFLSNTNKILDRKKRNKINGSGDLR